MRVKEKRRGEGLFLGSIFYELPCKAGDDAKNCRGKMA